MWHVTVEQMRLIEWARSWNWAVQFPGFGTPEDFKSWFPATDITYEIFHVDNYAFPAGVGEVDFPKATAIKEITMSCFDGGRRRGQNSNLLLLHQWIESWGNAMVDLKVGVQTLSEACRPITIVHYNPLSNTISKREFAVYPTGTYSFTGTSDESINKLDLTFRIAGTIKTDSILQGPRVDRLIQSR